VTELLLTLADIAAKTSVNKDTLKKRARREGWPFQEARRNGGITRLYAITNIPRDLQAAITLAMIPAPAAPAKPTPAASGEAAIALSRLTEKQRARFDARVAVIDAIEAWRRQHGLPVKDAAHAFAKAFNEGAPVVSIEIRAALPRNVSGHTVLSWMRMLKRGDVESLALAKKGRHLKGTGVIDRDAAVQDVVLGMLGKHSHISCTLLVRALRTKFADAGERVPSYATVSRWVRTWKRKNAQLFLAMSDPDAHRSKYGAAGGDASEGIDRPNQLWQVDSSPLDVTCSDGRRHTLISVIDVATRRLKFHVVRTSSADGVANLLRKAIIDWGVPDAIKSDNGPDYASKRIEDLARSLQIDQDFCTPFSPEQKPHVERSFRTFQHDLLELLDGFSGHDVRQKQAIRSRKSFAERMSGRKSVETRMTPAEVQDFCDKWCTAYATRPHRGLKGKSPLQVLAEWKGPIRRIENERALDILIMPAPKDGGWRVVGKKGVSVEGGEYNHRAFGGMEGSRVFVRLDPEDIGRIYVYDDNRDFICIAEDPAISGVSRAAVAAERKANQQQTLAEQTAANKRQRKSSAVTAMEILEHEVRQASKLSAFPKRTETHTTDDLDQAARAAEAKDSAAAAPAERLKRRAPDEADLPTAEEAERILKVKIKAERPDWMIIPRAAKGY
jgi:transposase InsO family protein